MNTHTVAERGDVEKQLDNAIPSATVRAVHGFRVQQSIGTLNATEERLISSIVARRRNCDTRRRFLLRPRQYHRRRNRVRHLQ